MYDTYPRNKRQPPHPNKNKQMYDTYPRNKRQPPPQIKINKCTTHTPEITDTTNK